MENGVLYTLGDLLEHHQVKIFSTVELFSIICVQRFVEAGSDTKKQQEFENVTNPPLLTSSPDKLIIEILSVPQLHILLGKETKTGTLMYFILSRCCRKVAEQI